MKMTDDFKKGARGMIIYMVISIIMFPVFHLIKGDFDWGETLINAGLMIAIGLVLGILFFFGMRIPKKKDEEPLTGYEKKLRRRYEKLIRSRTPKNTSLMAMTPTELETAAGMDGPAARIVHDLYSRTRYSQEPATRESYAAFKEAVQQLPDADRSKTADV